MAPVTRYTRSGGASIAYQVAGEGPLDLLFMPGWISQIEHLWEAPALRRFLERLAVLRAADPVRPPRHRPVRPRAASRTRSSRRSRTRSPCSTPPARERAALFTYGLGGPVGALLAAEHPERVGALIMYASIARTTVGARLRLGDDARGARRVDRARPSQSWGEADSRGIRRAGAVDGRRPGADQLVRAHAAPRRQPGRGARDC